ncbi:exodeoxyribonuclease I [Solimicrobium silvestre]|uniref:Exodeoxyribonuclease I n=1 Tax=Solimicrobium silvestre TaxID=2099400 RepID=A0A2S9H5F8_9BURK|nr:exodeoxyribonuclease I [Solimicrobium silvestre]PRC95106.1 Exonuclease I [Solimicrobium silvestre]
MQAHTFLWHDYETFGANTRRDRPAQFAAIRTDADLNEVGEPMMWYCLPAPDFLPEPQACLITGITPQMCLERGIPEYQFAQQINQQFSEPGTIGVGYNTIRFDDEITRFMLWRNLLEPYAREWQNQCGRWDILDMLRTTYALRPEGINWPRNDEGKVSFKLEHLCAANGIAHESAHDALSDVRATIALAKLVRKVQPKLFDFCFSLHKKDKVAAEIGLPEQRPFLHVTGMIPVENGCLCIAWPLAPHPTNKNEVISWNLAYDPRELLGMNAEAIRLRMFSKADALPEGVTRLPIKGIHLNKSPIVIGNLKTLQPAMAEQWGISVELAMQHAEYALALPDLNAVWQQVFKRENNEAQDVDQDLYNGFIGNTDRRSLQSLVTYSGEKLARTVTEFQDARLDELLFRYRARNFPETLSEQEAERWDTLRASRFFDGSANALTVDAYFAEIDRLSEQASEQDEEILASLYDYAEQIVPVQN